MSWLGENLSGPALLILFAACTGALGALWASFGRARSEWELRIPILLIFIAAISGALGAFLASSERTRFERELRKKSEELASLNQRMVEKSDEIAELNRKIAATITGGDSYCYLAFTLGQGPANSPLLLVSHRGEYPLYDVSIRIVDLKKFDRKSGDWTLEKAAGTETYLKVGNLSPGQDRIWGKWQLPETDQQDYNVFLSARNGFVTQFIRLRRVNGRWKIATKVFRDFGKQQKVIFEDIGAEFPRDEKGKEQW